MKKILIIVESADALSRKYLGNISPEDGAEYSIYRARSKKELVIILNELKKLQATPHLTVLGGTEASIQEALNLMRAQDGELEIVVSILSREHHDKMLPQGKPHIRLVPRDEVGIVVAGRMSAHPLAA